SVRRFNETFRALYGRPPASLRRARARAEDAGDVVLELAFRPPYDWDALLGFLAMRAIPGVEVVRDRSYARTIAVGDKLGFVRVEPAGRAEAARATIRFPALAALPAIVARLRRVFDLSADPLAIGAHLAEDPALAALVAERPGLRVPGA